MICAISSTWTEIHHGTTKAMRFALLSYVILVNKTFPSTQLADSEYRIPVCGIRYSELLRTMRLSDVNLLRHFEGVIDLNTQVADGTVQLGVTEQQLNGSEVLGPPIEQSCFGAPH